MKTYLVLLVSMLLIASQNSCDKKNDPGGEIDLNTKSQSIVDADNAFGIDLFKVMSKKENKVNYMISPLSISMALSMAYNGAEAETKAQMAEALRMEDFTLNEINETNQHLIEALSTVDPKVLMEIANSIWYKDGYPVEQGFLEVNQIYYDAEVRQADFNDVTTVDLINQWVSDKTHKKIPTIIDKISPMTVMYIINAIYFNGTWTQEFNPENTKKESFRLSTGDYEQVDMMQRLDTVSYFSNETFSSIEIPYGDGNFNLMLMLPEYEKSVSDVVDLMTTENWNKWLKEFEMTNGVDIQLPKFKIEYEKSLKEFLTLMGMDEAFSTNADFSNINTNKDLFISEVIHKTFIEVDEEGTEAAAVTAIVFDTTSFDPNKPQKTYFHCNRPFLFALTEKDTGALLFMGKVGNPVD